ncbi:MAG: DUF3151 family protein [bacterium]|nr:DUF3151 family protein [bacterium]
MPIDIPIGKPHVVLTAGLQDSDQQADTILATYQAETIDADSCRERLSALAARYPTSLNAWAGLGELALPNDVIAAYAFFRTGYHRGLDRARASGWNGSQRLRWEDEGNRGFLRCLHGLMQAATEIGETDEATRTGDFLLDLDPSDPFRLAPSEGTP